MSKVEELIKRIGEIKRRRGKLPLELHVFDSDYDALVEEINAMCPERSVAQLKEGEIIVENVHIKKYATGLNTLKKETHNVYESLRNSRRRKQRNGT